MQEKGGRGKICIVYLNRFLCVMCWHQNVRVTNQIAASIMKSTEVQNPRCVPRIRPNNVRLLATHRGATVLLPDQYSLLRRLAASCIVWGKAEPAIQKSSTMH